MSGGYPSCNAQASHGSGFSYCGAQAQGTQASVVTALFFFKKILIVYRSYDKPRQNIKKQRHYFANKGPYSQIYGFSSRGIWPRDVLKKVSRGLSRVEAGHPGVPRLVQVTSGGFSWWL